jgi:hypothetical protein
MLVFIPIRHPEEKSIVRCLCFYDLLAIRFHFNYIIYLYIAIHSRRLYISLDLMLGS